MAGPAVQAHLTPAHLLPKISPDQENILQKNFEQNRNPADFEVTLMAAEVGITEGEVKAWFRHQLAVWRRQQGLPANERPVND